MTHDDPYATIAHRLGGRLIRRWALEGGVSADVQALELALPDGATERVVVRQHITDGWKPLEPGVTSTEHALLTVLADIGLPVPRPRMLDLSGALLPAPYLVLSFVEGTTVVEPAALPQALDKMAAFLARLHGLDSTTLAPPTLPRRDDPMPDILEYLPAMDESTDLRALLKEQRASPRSMESTLLHGDFWSGNVLWREGRIAAVIDWEDAAVGDPISDLAGCRVELLWKYGEAAMEAFTTHYLCYRDLTLDGLLLALWELHVGSAALAFMGRWGLDPAVEAEMRTKTLRFLERASELVSDCLRTD